MKYIRITANRFDDVIKYLRYTFFVDEPLNKAVELCKPGEGHAESEKYANKTMEEGFSVVAVSDDDEIAGIALNGIVTKSSKQCKFEDIQQLKDEKFKKILSLLYSINSKVNFFKEFDVDELFEVRILSVNPKFRGQGIAKHLLQQSEAIARENGFKVMKSDGTSLFSQKVHLSVGFEIRYELRYDDYRDENNQPGFSVEAPHESIQILYKYLDDDEHVTSF